MTYQAGQPITCPNPDCKAVLEGPVEDLVVPGIIGPMSTADSRCPACGLPFSVEQTAPGVFEVEGA